jgi:hypothetical protein
VLQPDIDVMNLAALVYAVHVNACASLQAPLLSLSFILRDAKAASP